MISTKGRYSIRILLDLAEHRNGSYIPMKDVAARQNISLKYIERLMPALKAAGLVEGCPAPSRFRSRNPTWSSGGIPELPTGCRSRKCSWCSYGSRRR